jgi:hypothetical protein
MTQIVQSSDLCIHDYTLDIPASLTKTPRGKGVLRRAFAC